eukprot:5200502-Pleurochrysis_carterae.AAC.3
MAIRAQRGGQAHSHRRCVRSQHVRHCRIQFVFGQKCTSSSVRSAVLSGNTMCSGHGTRSDS